MSTSIRVHPNGVFEPIREKYGQRFLEEYNHWSKIDSKETSFMLRIGYFNITGNKLKDFLSLHPEYAFASIFGARL
jgi:hypothetical protein